jgi:O-antigen ligase
MIVGRGPSGLVYLKRAAPGAVRKRSLPFIVRWSFLLFVFLIGFDVSSWTARIGFLLFAIYFGYHNPFFGKRSFPRFPRVIIWFMIYVAVYALNGFFLPAERLDEFFTRLSTLVAMIIFLWIASDILKDEKMLEKALLAYCIGTSIIALGLVLSIPGFTTTGEVGIDRVSVIGMSPYTLALAVVALLGLWQNLSHKRLVASVWMFGSIFAVSLATVYSGSRGGVVMLMLGLSVYTVPYWKNRWRLSAGIVALIGMAGLAYIAAMTPAFSERWREYTEEDDTSGRDLIYGEAFDMISERPLVGWQPVEFWYELGSRTGIRNGRDAHNIFLHVLLEVGIVGAAPFLIGLWLCGKGAWNARNRNLGLLPLALLVASLAGGMSMTPIYLKPLWFVLAVTVAAAGEKKQPAIILLRRAGNHFTPSK